MKAKQKEREVDLSTDLPTLPQDQFWRVTHFNDPDIYGTGYYIELRERTPTKRRPDLSRLVDRRRLEFYDEPEEVTILRCARDLIEDRTASLRVSSLVGDYHPKRQAS